jgi:hypothetical protein
MFSSVKAGFSAFVPQAGTSFVAEKKIFHGSDPAGD